MAKKVEYYTLRRDWLGDLNITGGSVRSRNMCYRQFRRFAGIVFKLKMGRSLKLKRTLLKNGFKLEVVK